MFTAGLGRMLAISTLPPVAALAEGPEIRLRGWAVVREWQDVVDVKDRPWVDCWRSAAQNATELVAGENSEPQL